MNAYTKCFALFVVLLAACSLTGSVGAATAYELAAGKGTDYPTLEEARDRVRELRLEGTVAADQPVVVTLAPGDYVLTETLTLSSLDSGAEGATITWRAATRGTVRLLGAEPLSAERFSTLPTDDPIRSRITAAAAAKVFVADLSDILPETFATWEKSFRTLPAPWFFRGGSFQDLARYPNRTSDASFGWSYSPEVTSAGGSDKTGVKFKTPDAQPGNWDFDEGVWLYGFWGNLWSENYVKAGSWDSSTKVMTLEGSVNYVPSVGTTSSTYPKYIAVNVPEELDAEGEWWLNRSTRRFYYVPPAGGLSAQELAITTFADSLLTLSAGLHDVRFENLVFSYAGAGFTSQGETRRVTFEGCDLIALVNPSSVSGTDNAVRNCTFRHFGCGCLTVAGGTRTSLSRARNVVTGCTFTDYGRLQMTSVPAVNLTGCGQAVRHCTISEGPHEAVRYQGNEHFIGFNVIHDVLRETADAGAIYTGRDTSALGTLIVGNTLYDLAGHDVSGIYFDDCDWGDDAIANVFTNVYRSFLVGGGNLHRLQWNQVKGGARGISIDRRGVTWKDKQDWLKDDDWYMAGFTTGGLDPESHPWTAVYPDLVPTMDGTPREPYETVIRGNLLEDCSDEYTSLVTVQDPTSEYAMTNGMDIADNVTASSSGQSGGTTIIGITHYTRSATVSDVPGLSDALARVAALASATTEVSVTSLDGKVCAYVGLDETARLYWRATSGGVTALDRSALGVTVDGIDYGSLQRPCVASATTTTSSTYKELTVPLEDVVRGGTDASLVIRVYNDSISWSLCVPGTGTRPVAGYTADWRLAENGGFSGDEIPTEGWSCTGKLTTDYLSASNAPAHVEGGCLYIDIAANASRPLTLAERTVLLEDQVTSVMKTGDGKLVLGSALSGYTGTWTISEGNVSVETPYDAFGSVGDATVTAVEDADLDKAPIVFASTAAIGRPITVQAADHKGIEIAGGAEVSFLKLVTTTTKNIRFVTESGSVARFRGGFNSSNLLIPSGSGSIVFCDVPATINYLWLESSANIRFDCRSNYVGNIYCGGSSDGHLFFGCDDALARKSDVPVANMGGYTFDLEGHDLTVGYLEDPSSGCITSADPATFRFTVNSGKTTVNNNSDVTGAASLYKTGAGTYELNRSISSTGNLTVDQGIVRLTANASWSQAGCATASGSGCLEIEGSNSVFGESTCLAVSSGGCVEMTSAEGTFVCGGLSVSGAGSSIICSGSGARTVQISDNGSVRFEIPSGGYSQVPVQSVNIDFAGNGTLAFGGVTEIAKSLTASVDYQLTTDGSVTGASLTSILSAANAKLPSGSQVYVSNGNLRLTIAPYTARPTVLIIR